MNDRKDKRQPNPADDIRFPDPLHEHPWDTGPGHHPVSGGIGRAALSIVVACAVLMLVPSLLGQALPPTEEIDRKPRKEKIVLEGKARQLATNYVDLLDQLKFLAEDFSAYYSESKLAKAQYYRAYLKSLAKKVNEGLYVANVELLEDDLEKLRDRIDTFQDHLDDLPAEQQRDRDIQKLQRLNRNLWMELELLEQQFHEEIERQIEARNEIRHEVQVYFRDSLESASGYRQFTNMVMVIDGDSQAVVLPIPNAESWAVWAESLSVAFETIEGQPWVRVITPDIPAPPAPPAVPGKGERAREKVEAIAKAHEHERAAREYEAQLKKQLIEKSRTQIRGLYDAGEVREFLDSSNALPQWIPIVINNPIGELNVRGWNRDYILVRSEIGITSRSPQQAKAVADEVTLLLEHRSDTVFLEFSLPPLEDLHTGVAHCILDIKTPAGNKVVANSSHGTINLSGLKAGLELTGANSERVNIGPVRGDVIIRTRDSELMLTELTSSLVDVRNSQGAIEIMDSRGTFRIENSLAPVIIADSRGDVVIRNTGRVEVTDHFGKVDIENSNGEVDILRVVGDVSANNAYKMLRVEQITGATGVHNINGPIMASQLFGQVKATNKYGLVDLSEVRGPLDISNTKGTISLALDETYNGDCTIVSQAGAVDLRLPSNGNLTLKTTMVGGTLRTPLPIAIDRVGETETGKLVIGSGGSVMNVSATNSKVMVQTDD